MENIIRAKIDLLEQEYKRVEKKIFPVNQNTTKYAIEAEKIKFAIMQLYSCLGESGK